MKIFLRVIALVLCIWSAEAQLSAWGGRCVGQDGRTEGCDHEKTFLYCFEGKCQCPDSNKMASANIPMNLYTVWNKDEGKCLAIRDSSCGVQPGGNKLDCWTGLNCKLNDNAKIGTCGSSALQIGVLTMLISLYSVLKAL